MATLTRSPLPGAGFGVRALAWLRGLQARRLVLALVGVDTVVLQGHVFALRARPLGVCRNLVPAIIRCSRRFAAWEMDEVLYDDLVQVLSLGLKVSPRVIEQLSIPPWELAPVIEQIARVNGLPVLEAGRTNLGELVQVLTKSTGTTTSPASSAPPAGPGITSTSN
jgi:hypothetical protein